MDAYGVDAESCHWMNIADEGGCAMTFAWHMPPFYNSEKDTFSLHQSMLDGTFARMNPRSRAIISLNLNDLQSADRFKLP